jgi:gliding motility-associated-like protein
MNKKLLFLSFLLFSVPAIAQFPGGINTGLRVWLKANGGTTVTANTVTQWDDLSGAGLTGNFNTASALTGSLAPGLDPAGINFNPHLVFDRSRPHSLASINQFAGTSLFDPNNCTVLQVIKLHTFSGTGVWLKWQFSNTSARLGFEVNNDGTNDGRLRFDFNGAVRGTTNYNDRYVLANFYANTTQKGINVNGAVHFTGATANNNTTCIGRLAVGNEPPVGTNNVCGAAVSVDSYPTTFDVAELIVFNRALTAAERNKVESYLAVKYGFTLDQGAVAANNYTSANNTVIWNRAANLPFVNNITGIGRSDGDSLVQRQSRSINTGTGLVTIYNGTYNGANTPATNVANTNNFPADNSYLLFGDNGLALSHNRCVSVGGTGFLRMDRVWKAQKTGTINAVTLAIRSVEVPVNTRHLLVSSDSSFSPATTTIYRLDNVSGLLSRTITFPDANNYFTFASDSLIAHPTSNSPLCEGATLQLNANIAGLTSYSWTGPNGFTSIVQNPTIVGAGLASSGTYTLNAAAGSCVLPPASVNVVVSRKPAPPTVVTPIIYCQYATALPLSATGTDLKWYSQPVGGTGVAAPVIPSTLYEDTLVYWVTQSNQGCESIRSKQVVEVRYKPNGIILGTQSSVCQGSVDTFEFFGNARPSAVFDFKTPAFYSTVLSGSRGGPYIVRFDSAGTFTVRMQINNDGCVSDEMTFTVTVRPSPAILISAKENACVDEVVNVALYYTTSSVTRYSYDFDNGEMVYGTATGGPYGIRWHTPGTKVIAADAYTVGCPSRTTYDTIIVHPFPDARIRTISRNSICTGDSVLFTASEQDSNSRFYWTPDNFFSSGNIYQAWGVVKKDGFVRLDVESKWGCRSSDSVKIDAKPCCELFFPNVFSPNNDGRNDLFHPVTQGHHNIASFRVLNRWGQVVYESRNERNGWDGTFNGKPQDVGTYYYYIKFQCSTNEYFEQKGEVLLLR